MGQCFSVTEGRPLVLQPHHMLSHRLSPWTSTTTFGSCVWCRSDFSSLEMSSLHPWPPQSFWHLKIILTNVLLDPWWEVLRLSGTTALRLQVPGSCHSLHLTPTTILGNRNTHVNTLRNTSLLLLWSWSLVTFLLFTYWANLDSAITRSYFITKIFNSSFPIWLQSLFLLDLSPIITRTCVV